MPPGSRITPQVSHLTKWRYKHTGNAVKKVLDRDPRPLDEAYQDGYEEAEDGTVRRKKPVPWDDTYLTEVFTTMTRATVKRRSLDPRPKPPLADILARTNVKNVYDLTMALLPWKPFMIPSYSLRQAREPLSTLYEIAKPTWYTKCDIPLLQNEAVIEAANTIDVHRTVTLFALVQAGGYIISGKLAKTGVSVDDLRTVQRWRKEESNAEKWKAWVNAFDDSIMKHVTEGRLLTKEYERQTPLKPQNIADLTKYYRYIKAKWGRYKGN